MPSGTRIIRDIPPLSQELKARFWAKVALPNEQGCMLWMGAVGQLRYGAFCIRRQPFRAHRISYFLAYGPIPEGLVIDHLCRVRHCVAPLHLEAVTQRENLLRGNTVTALRAAKTHCPQGHPYSGENLYVDAKSRRYCRTCRSARQRQAG